MVRLALCSINSLRATAVVDGGVVFREATSGVWGCLQTYVDHYRGGVSGDSGGGDRDSDKAGCWSQMLVTSFRCHWLAGCLWFVSFCGL